MVASAASASCETTAFWAKARSRKISTRKVRVAPVMASMRSAASWVSFRYARDASRDSCATRSFTRRSARRLAMPACARIADDVVHLRRPDLSDLLAGLDDGAARHVHLADLHDVGKRNHISRGRDDSRSAKKHKWRAEIDDQDASTPNTIVV